MSELLEQYMAVPMFGNQAKPVTNLEVRRSGMVSTHFNVETIVILHVLQCFLVLHSLGLVQAHWPLVLPGICRNLTENFAWPFIRYHTNVFWDQPAWFQIFETRVFIYNLGYYLNRIAWKHEKHHKPFNLLTKVHRQTLK